MEDSECDWGEDEVELNLILLIYYRRTEKRKKMDFSALALVGLIIIIGLAMIAIPSFLTFLIYRNLKRKGGTKKKVGFAIFALTILATLLIIIKLLVSGGGFGPEYDEVEIKQKIGGTLICSSVYNADIHDWQYQVSYEYKPMNSDSILKIGDGTYHTREWNKDEQLVKYKNWTILKTGGWIGFDKVLIGDITANKWTEYNFSAEDIEREKLWVNSKTKSLLNYCCSESFIDKINNGLIYVHYKFRTNETFTEKYGERQIIYKIDDQTGQPIMIAIK